jgi:lipid-A-disaccharide synthase
VGAPTILLSAGDPSGDLHGAALAHALKRLWPEATLFGLGGPRMAAAGVELMADPAKLAVMGFVEVAGRIPYFMRLFRRVRTAMETRRADLVIPIDYPGFNLRLARAARSAKIPVLYYIAPQVWAWHRSRIRQLAEDTDRIAVVLPFEERIFREAGARATFVGHPLLDAPPPGTRQALCRQLNIEEHRPILALFPGSRPQEVARHMAIFVETAIRVRAQHSDIQPVVAVSSAVPARAYEGLPFPRTPDSWDLLWHAHAALVKSGTTTLEAALARTPMAIAYRTHPLTYWLARRLVEVDHIGLVNLVAGKRLVPEFLQDEATPAALAPALLSLIRTDRPDRDAALEGLDRVRAALAPPPGGPARVADRVAALAAELIPHAS